MTPKGWEEGGWSSKGFTLTHFNSEEDAEALREALEGVKWMEGKSFWTGKHRRSKGFLVITVGAGAALEAKAVTGGQGEWWQKSGRLWKARWLSRRQEEMVITSHKMKTEQFLLSLVFLAPICTNSEVFTVS